MMTVVEGEKTVVARWMMTREQAVSSLSTMSTSGHHTPGMFASSSSRAAQLWEGPAESGGV